MTLLVSAEAEAYRVRCLRMETPYDPLWCCCAEWFDYWDESVPVADGPHAVACEGCKYDRPTSRSASVKSVPGGIDGTTPRLLETPDTRVSEDPPLEPVARLDRRATSTDVPPAPGAARALTRHDGGTGPTSPSPLRWSSACSPWRRWSARGARHPQRRRGVTPGGADRSEAVGPGTSEASDRQGTSDMAQTLTDASVKSITRSLRDFGYTSLSEQEVREAADRVLAGEKPTDIIAMFVADMIRKAGLMPEADRA